MDEESNYLGAMIFWFYILAALSLIAVVIRTNIWLPQGSIGKNGDGRRRKEIVKFSAMATLSFATLSFNMLSVLIKSFKHWSDPPSAYVLDNIDRLISDIWTWPIESTLFQDFGNAIVENEARFFWTQAALLITLYVCFDMGIRGRQSRTPGLWALVGLTQILPISFAQNLFYVTTLRTSRNRLSSAVRLPRSPTVITIAIYASCLFAAPYVRQSSRLIEIILLARTMLLALFFLPRRVLANADDGRHRDRDSHRDILAFPLKMIIMLSTALMIKQGVSLAYSRTSWASVLQALFSHPAVSSLGVDFMLSVLSLFLWVHTQQNMNFDQEPNIKAS